LHNEIVCYNSFQRDWNRRKNFALVGDRNEFSVCLKKYIAFTYYIFNKFLQVLLNFKYNDDFYCFACTLHLFVICTLAKINFLKIYI